MSVLAHEPDDLTPTHGGIDGFVVEPGDMRLIPTLANGQPAAAIYMRNGEKHVAFQLHVLEMRPDGISRVVAFLDAGLFAKFGLPERP